MKFAPCKKCEKSPCGVYHDECPDYQGWLEYKEKYMKAKRQDGEYLRYKKEIVRKMAKKKNDRR